MSAIEDPLAKPVWPEVDASTQEAAVSQLIPLRASGTREDILIGFNAVMAGLEEHFRGEPKVQTLFVARHDISGLESMPLALASAAGKIRLVTLPKGSKNRLEGTSVMCTLIGNSRTSLLEQLVQAVGPAEASWAYVGAKPAKLAKKPAKGAPQTGSQKPAKGKPSLQN